MNLNCFVPQQREDETVEEIEVTLEEIKAINFVDVEGLKYKKCAKKMKLSVNELQYIIINARKKIGRALTEGRVIRIIEEQPIKMLCKFRCAVCGEIYNIDYTKNEIICPLCFSKEIMTNKEAGFCNM
ncbi:DUF134 domain-containing protein [Romboutsia sedimentorum]|uniref:DUF134 domain-containing protein n=1 Tax=Romboutsia sedimentorum TaxID=1368474 RepID=UPI0024DE0FB9|nr:DUF134 domain-containing protein [Romboutsia sedimentorum]MDK2586755.1 DUF134 domain-containing protein [Romboutsia sedimentorum]